MLRKVYGLVPLIVLALPSFCHADISITFLDNGEPVQFLLNTLGPLPCSDVNPEHCSVFQSGPFTANQALLFNIFEPGGSGLSDTLAITTDASGGLTADFLSDTDGGPPLVPLSGGTLLTENGTIQTAATIPFLGSVPPANLIVRFESDTQDNVVPEPGLLGLLSLIAVGMWLAARRRVINPGK